jgi:hypothetical protein
MKIQAMILALIAVSSAPGFAGQKEPSPTYPKVYQCVLGTAGVVEAVYNYDKNPEENWSLVSHDLIASAPTRLGAIAALKTQCVALASDFNNKLRRKGASEPTPDGPLKHEALVAHTLHICDQMMKGYLQCEVGELPASCEHSATR